MDYTGLLFGGYGTNRPLTAEEKRAQLPQKKRQNVEPATTIALLRLNSTFMEYADRWFMFRGSLVWVALLCASPCIFGIGLFLWNAINHNDWMAWGFWLFVLALTSPLLWFLWYLLRREIFRYTHYPIRFNRKRRQVHIFRTDGTVSTYDWDDLFITLVGYKEMMTPGRTYDIRAYVLGDDGKTIEDAFALGYVFLGTKESTLRLWEFIRRYMEAADGVEKNYELVELCPPVDGQREGFMFGVTATFANVASYPWLQLLMSPLFAITAAGRWIAMTSSKIPRWPEEIEAECEIAADDPYEKDASDNGKFSFGERWWPMICFAIGAAIVVWVFMDVVLL